MLPLALDRGIGAELRNGVGVASVDGILVSGILMLFMVPILYDMITRKSKTVPIFPVESSVPDAADEEDKTESEQTGKGTDTWIFG